MPLYEYRCEKCRATDQGMRKIEERYEAPECFRCKQPMLLIVSAPAGIVKDPAVPRRLK